MKFDPIGIIHSPYQKKDEIPIHKYKKNEVGKLEVYKEYEKGLKDIEGFSHLFIIFVFDESRKK